MKEFILLLLFCHVASPVTHSLKYFFTASSGVSNFPEFVADASVDEVQMVHYDSNIKKVEPKQDWMSKLIADDPQHLEWYTARCVGFQLVHKAELETLTQRFNQTGGVHIYQKMYGCEWDDETGDVNGLKQYGYDGEDFIVLVMKTWTWIASTPQAVITKHKWDNDKARLAYLQNFYTKECIDRLKKYLDYGKSTLQRTVLPLVSLLQKSPSSPVSCHATGFYPDKGMLFWTRDGEEVQDLMDQGESFPNHDGTFQTSVQLDVSSVKPEDWGKYECVFQLSGVKKDIVTKLDPAVIKTNNPGINIALVIGVSAGLLLLLAICIAGVFIWRRNNNGFRPANSSPSGINTALVIRVVAGLLLLLAICIAGVSVFIWRMNNNVLET
ncbi:major histocompatibility complex class I-related gene protein-like isoform X1 [Centroberyx affinis]|uniref:major histocompatibility complex class I-related gene protein-like isoform X1 n=1 Tax=Centroberyx affinis TaxID=166261 RepID=UPI003A5BB1A2